jgi:membrane protease YdiL (CAAX protease family)
VPTPCQRTLVEKMLRWSEAGWSVFLMLLPIALLVTLFTFAEEYSWRGYLLFFQERLTPHVD